MDSVADGSSEPAWMPIKIQTFWLESRQPMAYDVNGRAHSR